MELKRLNLNGDSTYDCIVAGCKGCFVPSLISRLPEDEPEECKEILFTFAVLENTFEKRSVDIRFKDGSLEQPLPRDFHDMRVVRANGTCGYGYAHLRVEITSQMHYMLWHMA